MNAWLFRGGESYFRQVDCARAGLREDRVIWPWATRHKHEIKPGDIGFLGYFQKDSRYGTGCIYAIGEIVDIKLDGLPSSEHQFINRFVIDQTAKDFTKPHAAIKLHTVADQDSYIAFDDLKLHEAFRGSKRWPTNRNAVYPVNPIQSDLIRSLLEGGEESWAAIAANWSPEDLWNYAASLPALKISEIPGRRRVVRDAVLADAKGMCQFPSCGWLGFAKNDGSKYLEAHHVWPLAEGGPDTLDNVVALCPNCHRALHHAKDRDPRDQQLRAAHPRLRPRKG